MWSDESSLDVGEQGVGETTGYLSISKRNRSH